MPVMPRGHLTDDGHVVVPDQAEANRLYNKGAAGIPQRGGSLRLTLVEALRLVEEERLGIWPDAATIGDGAPMRYRDLFALGLRRAEDFEIPLFAYRDLRARGRVAKPANRRNLDYLVYAEGDAPPKDAPRWLAGAFSEREPVTAERLFAWLEEAREEDAMLMLLIVDEEGDLTHYEVDGVAPAGQAPALDLGAPLAGHFAEDRVVVWGEADAGRLRDPHFLGKPMPGGLQMSLVEAAALIQEGHLEVDDFWARAEKVQPDLRLRAACYRALRAQNLWVKTGFKFGTHFRVYDKHPDESHAPWLVHSVTPDWRSTWPEVSRAVRLAHSVRKGMLFSIVADDGTVRHVALRRIRP